MFCMNIYRLVSGVVLTIMWVVTFIPTAEAAAFKVLIVMSYEENNPWCMEIKEGINSVLGDTCDLSYFYMDTKVDLAGGKAKARDAYAMYRTIKPQGVIAADDNAQWMFVLPYLKEKVDTPVMFCGVNADPEKYGYPAANVSGSLERGHIRESIAFTKQLLPSMATIGFLAKDSPSGKALLKQVQNEVHSYLAKFTAFKLVSESKELLAAGKIFNDGCDAIYIDSVEGIVNEEGQPLGHREITKLLKSVFAKPIIGANQYHVKQGALCAVVKTGNEQGRNAAKMLLQAMNGVSVSDIPITKNYKGKRMINVSVMKAQGITPRPEVLLGAKLIKSEN